MRYWQIKAANASGMTNAFDWSNSVTEWSNVSASQNAIIKNLNYTSNHDEVEIDVKVEVPQREPPGTKKASIVLTWEESP